MIIIIMTTFLEHLETKNGKEGGRGVVCQPSWYQFGGQAQECCGSGNNYNNKDNKITMIMILFFFKNDMQTNVS